MEHGTCFRAGLPCDWQTKIWSLLFTGSKENQDGKPQSTNRWGTSTTASTDYIQNIQLKYCLQSHHTDKSFYLAGYWHTHIIYKNTADLCYGFHSPNKHNSLKPGFIELGVKRKKQLHLHLVSLHHSSLYKKNTSLLLTSHIFISLSALTRKENVSTITVSLSTSSSVMSMATQ